MPQPEPQESAAKTEPIFGKGKPARRWSLWLGIPAATFVFYLMAYLGARSAVESLFAQIETQKSSRLSAWAYRAPMMLYEAVPLKAAGAVEITRTVTLGLSVARLDDARKNAEEKVREHGGYFVRLETTGGSTVGRELSATIQIPADQLVAVLDALRGMGRVEFEAESSEEVAGESADLSARLANARATQDRLAEIARLHNGKVTDYLEVEKEIANMREEIEKLEAQSRKLNKRVRYAVLRLRLKEEHSPTEELRTALAEGLHQVRGNAFWLIVFLARYLPAVLFWLVLLFWPARFAWRKFRAAVAARQESASM